MSCATGYQMSTNDKKHGLIVRENRCTILSGLGLGPATNTVGWASDDTNS